MSEPSINVLIVVPCLNEELYLEALVKGIVRNYDVETAKVVIADGGSTDNSLKIAEELVAWNPRVVLLHNPAKIQSAGINKAVAEFGADAQYLIRIDAHADYPTNYIQVLVNEAIQKNADSVVVALETVGKKDFQVGAAAAQNSKLGNGGSAHRNVGEPDGQWVDHGHHALMRIDAFKAVQGYDESFACNEDAELDYRLKKADSKIWLTAETFATYYARSTPQALFKQYFGYGYGRARTILKHRLHPKARQLIPTMIALFIVLALFAPFKPMLALPFYVWFATCILFGFYLTYQNDRLTLAYTGPALLIMHSAWSFGFWKAVFHELRGRK